MPNMATAPKPLDAAGKAALTAEFGKTYDGMRLLDDMQSAVVAHFAAKGEGLTDVKSILAVSKANPAGTEQLWEALLVTDLGIKSAADIKRFMLWLHARDRGGAGAGLGLYANDQTRRALDVLDSHGLAISRDIKADLENALAAGEAGTEREQCCNALAVHILYLGRAPDASEEAWWADQYNRLGGRVGGKVEITKSPTYQKAHAKSPQSVLTLERALMKEDRFTEWSVQTVDALNACGLPKASSMLMKVLAQANRMAGGSWLRKRVYLFGYFFEEFTGLGLPEEYATRSAFNAMAMAPPPAFEKNLSEAAASEAALTLGSSRLSDYERLGGSVSLAGSSAGFDMRELASLIKTSIEQGLAPLKELGSGGGGGKGGSYGGCLYCRKPDCPMLQGGEPCKEARHAADLLRVKRKAAFEKKKAEGGEGKSSAGSAAE